MDDLYEWDENKRAINIEKHGIDFVDAVEVFSDPDRIELESLRYGEKRTQLIGTIHNTVVILLVYVSRHGKKRIISARRASKKERDTYYHLR